MVVVDPHPGQKIALLSDRELICKADEEIREEQLLAAHKTLLSVQDSTFLQERHTVVMKKASECQEAISDLLSIPDTSHGWQKQGVSGNGKRNFCIYYKVEDDAKLTCRIEGPIEKSLLVPLLSVLNEVDLYPTFIPSWSVPKIGIRRCRQLEQTTRTSQILQVACNVPWPFAAREIVMQVTGIDDIDESGFIAVLLESLEVGGIVPPPEQNIQRIDFEGSFLFRNTPLEANDTSKESVMVSFKMFVDAKMNNVPSSLINFVTRTVIGQIWSTLLNVAEQVRDGALPEHRLAIESKQDFYLWMGNRIETMLQRKESERKHLQPVTTGVHDMEFISYLQS